MGARCGRSFLICSTSSTAASDITAVSLILVLPALLAEPRQRMNLARPFSYRFRWRPAIIDAAFQKYGRSGSRTRTHPGASADMAVVAQAHLARQHHAVLQHHAAGEPGLTC